MDVLYTLAVLETEKTANHNIAEHKNRASYIDGSIVTATYTTKI